MICVPFVAASHSLGMRYPLLWKTRSFHKLSYQMKFWRYQHCTFYRTQCSILHTFRCCDQFDSSHSFPSHFWGYYVHFICLGHVIIIIVAWFCCCSCGRLLVLLLFVCYFIGFRAVCGPLFCLEAVPCRSWREYKS